MNQFSSLYYTSKYSQTMRDALDILAYCAEIDPQAQRVFDIVTRFSQVVGKSGEDRSHLAPKLSDDFNCLYNQPSRFETTFGHMHSGPVLDRSIHVRTSPQAASGPNPGLPTPPSIPKVPMLDALSAQAPSTALEVRAGDMSSPEASVPSGNFIGYGTSAPTQPSLTTTDRLDENFEFDIDRLWFNCANYLPPVTTMAPGMSSLALQFPPPVIGAPAEPYGAYLLTSNFWAARKELLPGLLSSVMCHSNFVELTHVLENPVF